MAFSFQGLTCEVAAEQILCAAASVLSFGLKPNVPAAGAAMALRFLLTICHGNNSTWHKQSIVFLVHFMEQYNTKFKV